MTVQHGALKTRLAAGDIVFGTMVFEFDSPGLARIVASAGADFIILDMEHSGWSVETIKRQIAHANGAGLVAPHALDAGESRLLDLVPDHA